MASVKVEFELQGGDKVVTTNEKIIKQLQEQGVAYQVLEGEIENTTQAYNESVDTQLDGNEKVSKSYKEFLKDIKAAEKELKVLETTGQQNSKRYQELVGRVSQFKDAQDELGRRLNANKSGADAFIGSVAGVAGGFAAVQGAIGLFGEESENVQKALLKVQSALSLAQGIEQIKDAKGAFQSLGTLISGNLTKAFSSLKGAIAASGIGLLIVGIGLLIANFDKIFPSAKRAEQAVTDLANALEVLKTTQDDLRRRRLDDQRVTEEQYKTQKKGEEELIEFRIKRANEEARQARIDRDNADRAYENQIKAAKGNAKLIDEIKKKQAADTQRYIELENQFATQSLILQENLEQERDRKREERQQKRLAAFKKDNERRVQLLQEGVNKELATLKLAYEEERKVAIQNGENLQLIDNLYQKNRLSIIDKYIKDYTDKSKKLSDLLLEENQTSFDKQLKDTKERYSEIIKTAEDAKKILIELERADGKNRQDEIKKVDEQINQLRRNQLAEETLLQQKAYNDYVKLIVDFNNLRGIEDKDAFDKRVELYDIEIETFIKGQEDILRSYLTSAKIVGDAQETQVQIFLTNLRIYLGAQKQTLEADRELQRANLDNRIDVEKQILQLNKSRATQTEFVNRQIKKLQDELRITEINNEIKKIDFLLNLYDKESTEYKKLILDKLKLQNQLSELTDKQNQSEIDRINSFIQKNQQVISAIQQSISDLNDAFNSFYDLRLAKLEAYYDKEFQLLDERKQREIENYALTQEEIQNINERYALEETALEEKKQKEIKEIEKRRANDQLAFTLAQIIANQSLAIIRAFAELGPIAGPIAAAAVGISTAAQVAAAINQRNIIVKYEKGGILNGMSHAQGGILAGGVELEGGEAVINRRSTAQFAPLLSAINMAGGGRPFTSPNLTGNLNLNTNPNTQSISRILDKMSTQRAYILSDDVQSDTARVSRIKRQSTF